ncbi:septum site-determining protein MinD [Aneurinibacillus uraniidurans]|uniref:septum site-determining protein MinD n=1 Tax=Aneurinibacillus uraniidurans TaxID=2966586 RepID=UPI00234B0E58|nr:septum site-determining protein MinD [Aneurinibacillus sp. B1]WCN38564.1 septum site-determining protein MinD [Aneurinibacillus sp. B1]
MSEAIVVTSGKGGVGKTTTTANIGTALAQLGKKVCMIDTDIGLRNLDLVMGLENRIIFDLVDVVEGNCKLHQAMIKDKRFDDLLYLLPAAQTKDKSAVTTEQMKKLVDELKADFDIVLIDCPAGIEQGFKNAVVGADKAIVVTTPEISSIRDADRVIGLLERENLTATYLVINRIRPHMTQSGDMLDVEDVVSMLSVDPIGYVPDDEEVIKHLNLREPVAMNHEAKAGIAYRNIARRMLGDSVPFLNMDEPDGFFKKVKRLFGMK